MIEIRKAEYKDTQEVAGLHQEFIKSGFLTSLGPSFLRILYKGIIGAENAFCVVAEKDGAVIGFACGTENISIFYRRFLIRIFFRLLPVFFSNIKRAAVLRKIFETVSYPRKAAVALPKAEWLSMVAMRDNEEGRISDRLFHKLVEQFRIRGIKEFKSIVGQSVIHSIKFNERMGGILYPETIEIHRGDKSNIYIFKVP